jgi:L-lactate dehydrogenase complex protein LldE
MTNNINDIPCVKIKSKKINQLDISNKNVGLFVTCLVNTMRPSVGFAALKLLEDAGCQVNVPTHQSCCGQPTFNSGDDDGARDIAYQVIQEFEKYDYVIVPSGSCAGMIKIHFIEIFNQQPEWKKRAQNLAHKTYELLTFLVDICQYQPKDIKLNGTYTYHDSCTGFRSLNIYKQPRKLLSSVQELTHKPLYGHSECCGFGGIFCVKYSNISNSIVTEKTDNIRNTNADYLLGGDLGCLMNIAGKLNREGKNTIQTFHAAEVLAGMVTELLKGK